MSTEESDSWKAMDSKELEKQYSPSLWSKRFAPGMAEFAHLHVIAKGYKDAIKSIPVDQDLSYGPASGQKLDLFSKAMPGCPIFAFVHGGYWQMLNKQQGGVVVKPLVEAGCTVALIGYDLAPTASMDVIVEEIQEAAKYLLDIAIKSKSRLYKENEIITDTLQIHSGVYFCGHSAGGHLTAMIATTEWLKSAEEVKQLIKGYICISGVYDLRPLITTSVNEPLGLNEDHAKLLSPQFLLDSIVESISKACPFLVAVGENDSPEFQRQSKLFQKSLEKKGANAQLLVIPEVDHFDIIERLNDSNFILTKKILELVSI